MRKSLLPFVRRVWEGQALSTQRISKGIKDQIKIRHHYHHIRVTNKQKIQNDKEKRTSHADKCRRVHWGRVFLYEFAILASLDDNISCPKRKVYISKVLSLTHQKYHTVILVFRGFQIILRLKIFFITEPNQEHAIIWQKTLIIMQEKITEQTKKIIKSRNAWN